MKKVAKGVATGAGASASKEILTRIPNPIAKTAAAGVLGGLAMYGHEHIDHVYDSITRQSTSIDDIKKSIFLFTLLNNKVINKFKNNKLFKWFIIPTFIVFIYLIISEMYPELFSTSNINTMLNRNNYNYSSQEYYPLFTELMGFYKDYFGKSPLPTYPTRTVFILLWVHVSILIFIWIYIQTSIMVHIFQYILDYINNIKNPKINKILENYSNNFVFKIIKFLFFYRLKSLMKLKKSNMVWFLFTMIIFLLLCELYLINYIYLYWDELVQEYIEIYKNTNK